MYLLHASGRLINSRRFIDESSQKSESLIYAIIIPCWALQVHVAEDNSIVGDAWMSITTHCVYSNVIFSFKMIGREPVHFVRVLWKRTCVSLSGAPLGNLEPFTRFIFSLNLYQCYTIYSGTLLTIHMRHMHELSYIRPKTPNFFHRRI